MEPKQPNLLEGQPVAVAGGAASIVGLIMAALLMLGSLGVIKLTAEQLDAVRNFLIPFVAIVGPLIAAWWARQQVTPLADPKTKDAQPAILMPVVQAQAMGLDPMQWTDDEPLPTGYGRKVER